jgi:DTW domain-containing protein
MKRLTCIRCQRPHTTCICVWVRPTSNTHQVLVLQHPLEVNNVKNSVALLRLSLMQCHVVVGEQFDPRLLEQLLYAPWPASSEQRTALPVLLYPGENTLASHRVDTPFRLVVLDATWRKSRKMLYLNPVLAALPRLALDTLAPSRYLVRKAQRPEQRSSLEAACAALAWLDPASAPVYEPVLEGFDGFVGGLIASRDGVASSNTCT